jgi:hypothetical protein
VALPTFFLAGTGKAGTTSLYHYLDQHPQIYMSPIKEPCYFASEIRLENCSEEIQPRFRRQMEEVQKYLRSPMSTKRLWGPVVEWNDYLRLFENVRDEVAVGEASVDYLYSKSAAGHIAATIPGARILIVLRNPVDRAYSQYLQAASNGLVRRSFREQIQENMRAGSETFGVLNPHLEYGFYSEQVKRYLTSFPRSQVAVFLYEDYRGRTADMLPDIFRFLNVDTKFVPDTRQRHLESGIPRLDGLGYALKRAGAWAILARLTPAGMRPTLQRVALKPRRKLAMDPRDRDFLRTYYRDDVMRLAALLDRDLTVWLR